MGTVIASRWQMQAYKDAEITCVLKVGYTEVKSWVRYIALHPGVSARNAGFDEELVARLRKDVKGGGAVLGPFKTAESLWEASKDGAAFKLGMTLKGLRRWMRWMARLRGEESVPVFVYRIFPAEANTDLVWNGGYQFGDDWASGFARSKNQRGRGIRFYVKRRSASTKVSHALPMQTGGVSRAQWRVLQAQPRFGRIGPVPSSAHDMPPYYVRVDAGSSGEALAGSSEEVQAGAGSSMPLVQAGSSGEVQAGAGSSMPLVREDAGAAPPAGSSMEMPHAIFRAPENQATAEMARLTEEMARAFRETGRRNGMDVVVLIAVEKMEEALASVAGRLVDGSLHGLTVALFDLRMAIEEYAWAVTQCGWDAGYVGRVRNLSRIIAGIEHGVEHSLHMMALNSGRV